MPPFITVSASGYPEGAIRLAMFLNPGWRVMFPVKTTRVWMFRRSRNICRSRRVKGADSRTVSGNASQPVRDRGACLGRTNQSS